MLNLIVSEEPKLYSLLGAELAVADGCYAYEGGKRLLEGLSVSHSFENCLLYCEVRIFYNIYGSLQLNKCRASIPQ